MVVKLNSLNKTLRGQFFSFDVIASSVIFLLAFFLLAFYWINAQNQLAQQTYDLQSEAERIANQLMVPDTEPPPSQWYAEFWDYAVIGGGDPNARKLDDYVMIPFIRFVSNSETPNEIDPWLFIDFGMMCSGTGLPSGSYYYAEVKEKLGIPQYEFWITLEDTDGTPITVQGPVTPYIGGSPPYAAEAGKDPANHPTTPSEIATAERIVLIDARPDSNPHELVKLRVQVWRP
ncbi:hypothetical protein DRN67_00565 [Candidatus Micrarchaeota archaeon]|nr:MAG: hypothetical protein DRN67_00565 [Candidatus Micrarchaeota archaeon]